MALPKEVAATPGTKLVTVTSVVSILNSEITCKVDSVAKPEVDPAAVFVIMVSNFPFAVLIFALIAEAFSPIVFPVPSGFVNNVFLVANCRTSKSFVLISTSPTLILIFSVFVAIVSSLAFDAIIFVLIASVITPSLLPPPTPSCVIAFWILFNREAVRTDCADIVLFEDAIESVITPGLVPPPAPSW